MKKLLLILTLISSSALAVSPARYNIFPVKKQKEVQGVGVEFKGPVKIIDDPVEKDEKGLPVKKMYMWISGCGDVEIKDKEAFKKLKNGTWAAIKLELNSCTVSGWRVF